ncbi:MAG: rod shape-determining protein [Clostridia bacterium]|nr:rod shape-determining protein [Clostridia bacterium]
MRPKIAIDIGTSYTKIYKAKSDVVLIEPTCIAIQNKNYKTPYAYGQEAYSLIGKTPESVEIIFPVSNTDIVDNKALVALLSHFIKKVKTPLENIKDALLLVECGSNRETIKKFENALIGAKVYNVCYAENPLLALLGVGEEISYETPSAVIDLGGGQTTVCVLTKAGVISGASAEIGGNTLNKMIIKHVEQTLNLQISEHSAEVLKVQLASLNEDDETKSVVSGKDTLSGKQKVSQISASQIYPAVKEFIDKVLNITNVIFSSLAGETIALLQKGGVYLSGGGVNIYGIDEYVSNALGIQTKINNEAEIASIIGAGKLVESAELLDKLKLQV